MKYLQTLFLLSIILFSCDESRVFEENKDFSSFEWSYDNIVKFEVNVNDSIPKNVLLNFRHTHYFATRNVRLKMHISLPSGEKTTTDINVPLSEPNGMWYADCSGDVCDIQYQLPSFKNYSFTEKGKYIFELEQDMRENPLKEVMSVGLRIENVLE